MNDTAPGQQSGNAGVPPQRARVLGQFIRDLSFENFLLQRGKRTHEPAEFQVSVNIEANPLKDDEFEALIRLQLTATEKESNDTLYYLELDYSGIFQVEEIDESLMQPFLMAECPRILFPFLRRIVFDVTRDGGFQPFNLDFIDFAQIYRAEVGRRAKAGNQDS